MSNKDSLPSMSGDLTLPKKDEIKFADYSVSGIKPDPAINRKVMNELFMLAKNAA